MGCRRWDMQECMYVFVCAICWYYKIGFLLNMFIMQRNVVPRKVSEGRQIALEIHKQIQ
jgi:hypothetical protein